MLSVSISNRHSTSRAHHPIHCHLSTTYPIGVDKADLLCRSLRLADGELNTRNTKNIKNTTNTTNTTRTSSSTSSNSISRRLLQHVPFCSSDPCPGMMNRNPSSCACECEMIESCPGNQVWNEPICQCGCSTTPTCIAPLTFNPIQVSFRFLSRSIVNSS